MTTVRNELWIQARFYQGFADISRLAILNCLREGERTVSEVATATRLSLSNASRHLACLRDCGLLEPREDWRYCHYRLANGVLKLLESNDAFIGKVANRIAACERPEMRRRDR